jgi:AcrR family transcriptional regulator
MTGEQPQRPKRSYGGVSAPERIAARRERFLDAGLQLFGTRGFAATGVKDICSEAGLTDRYFYESFDDRTALLVAVIDRFTGELFELVAQAALASPPDDPVAQGKAAIGGYVRALAANPAAARVLFTEAPAGGDEVEQYMRATLRRFAELVAATARAHLPADFSDSLLQLGALSVVGAIERVMIEWQDDQLDLTIDEIVDAIVGMLLAAGYAAGVPAGTLARRKR